ncbi:hypothetical protein KQX54_015077 [Cotesia glomerata]|uniref:Uncharacterized protein n=1 Tax=Cotesia glomerata TaxID=32391 RepID=A0AAV7J825_COTGL|nr:hypothetical protein KQX54_015077 [Cotesia glomerata]
MLLSAIVDGIYADHAHTAGSFTYLASSQLLIGGGIDTNMFHGIKGMTNFVGCLRKLFGIFLYSSYIYLSKNSSRARAGKVARNQESSVHAELRRRQQAERQSVLRATETPLQARVRSERQAMLQAARRTIETPEQLQARRIHNAEMQTTRRRNFMRKD